MLQFRAALFGRRTPRGEVYRAILGGNPASHCQDRPFPGGKLRSDDSERVALALDHLRGTTFTVEGIRECLLKGVSVMRAAGTQMRVVPEGFRTSTRVVT